MLIHYPRNFCRNRNKKIIEYCKGKNVLHIGSTDSPFTQEKLDGKLGPLLYAQVDAVCNSQLGIDLDTQSINLINQKKIFSNSSTIFYDMNQLQNLNYTPDVIIFGEVIEHLMNIEIALSNIKKVMDNKTILIISTPNAFFRRHIIYSFLGKEYLHPDHKVLFSYGYLKNMLNFNKIRIIESYFTTLDRYGGNEGQILSKIYLFLETTINKIAIYNRPTLLVICKKND